MSTISTLGEIPLAPLPVIFQIDLVGRGYIFRTQYRDADNGGWVLDIDRMNPAEELVHGIPLVTGLDLLWQHQHHDFRFHLMMRSDDDRDMPLATTLGRSDRLYYLTIAESGEPLPSGPQPEPGVRPEALAEVLAILHAKGPKPPPPIPVLTPLPLTADITTVTSDTTEVTADATTYVGVA